MLGKRPPLTMLKLECHPPHGFKLPDSPGSLTVTIETFFALGPRTVTSATIFVH